MSKSIAWRLLAASFLMFMAGRARAETTNCTQISSLPYNIATDGIYCLKGPVSPYIGTGVAITINATNVILDLNGWTVGYGGNGSGGASPSAVGIQIQSASVDSIIVENGTIVQFPTGVSVTSHSGSVHLTGLYVSQSGLSVTNYGIVVNGGPTEVEHCVVDLYQFGMVHNSSSNDTAHDNVVSRASQNAFWQGSTGYWLLNNNQVLGAPVGVYFGGSGGCKFRHTFFSNVATQNQGCSDAGDNF